MSSECRHNMVNFGLLAAEICLQVWVPLQISTGFASWQHYCTASSSGRQPNFAALNRGRHLNSAGRPSRWALAHISSFKTFTPNLHRQHSVLPPAELLWIYRPFPPQNCLFVFGDQEPMQHSSLGPPESTARPERHHDRFSRFCTASQSWQTDWHTRLIRCSNRLAIAIAKASAAMQPKNTKISLIYIYDSYQWLQLQILLKTDWYCN